MSQSQDRSVFISYSRRDTDFARRLKEALVRSGCPVWIDSESIPGAAQWQIEIEQGIVGADNFIFILSEHSVASEYCNEELRFALAQNKRIIPLLRLSIEKLDVNQLRQTWASEEWEYTANANWDALRHIQGLAFFDEETLDFYEAFKKLLAVLAQDSAHARLHTRLLGHIRLWEDHERNPDYLLRGDELREFRRWQRTSAGKTPALNEQHQTYLRESRLVACAARQQQRWLEKEAALQRQIASEQRERAALAEHAADVERENAKLATEKAESERARREMVIRLVSRYVGGALGFGLGMGITIYVLYGDGTDTQTRVRSAVALGSQYGLLMGYIILFTTEWAAQAAPSQQRIRAIQAIIAGALGFIIVFALLRLSRGQAITGWGWLFLSGILFAGTFTLTSLMRLPTIVKMLIATAGAFAAFFLPWLIDPRSYPLFLFSTEDGTQALILSLAAAVATAFFTFLPDLIEPVLKQFSRIRGKS
jgi:hypothetical protein